MYCVATGFGPSVRTLQDQQVLIYQVFVSIAQVGFCTLLVLCQVQAVLKITMNGAA